MTSGSSGLADDLSRDTRHEELDFSDLFLYNSSGEDFPVACDKDDAATLLQNSNQPALLLVDTVYGSSSNMPTSQNPSSCHGTTESLSGVLFDSMGLTARPATIPAPSPRIEITLSGDSLSSRTLELSPGSKALGGYRECASPASSNSSTGWSVEVNSPLASPCVSPSNGGVCGTELSTLDLCPSLQGIHTSSSHSSPGASPRNSMSDESYLLPRQQRTTSPLTHQRSRSASPHGKRSYEQVLHCQGGTPIKQRSRSASPIPSPHGQQGSCCPHQAQAEFQPQFQTSTQGLEEMLSSLSSSLHQAVPSVGLEGAHGAVARQACVYGKKYDYAPEEERIGGAETVAKSERLYMLPALWPSHPVYQGALSGLCMAPPPPLEWPVPSQSGQYELLIQQQPRSHHRAHYETEGSRGAVKTPSGGHPEVQLRGYQGTAPLGLQVFIGTADERLLKPHAFYQVHRITGKTVTTPSMERMINGTKVLEIPLEPNNHMGVVIDCVGILKLRNADIELKNGETDIGRKNTRVRLVFRVHIPQSGGQLVSLQVTSHPIECSQRSAQGFSAVKKQDLSRCSVFGGQQMVLTGQSFTSDSKVMFSEKTQDGQQIWEMKATVDRDKTQASMLFNEVPQYRGRTICHPTKGNFYARNGQKKSSQPQHLIYTPVIAIKAEPLDERQLNTFDYSDNTFLSDPSMKLLSHHLEQDNNLQASSVSPTRYHLASDNLRAHMLTSDSPDDQLIYNQPKPGILINSPVMYHTANQHYSTRTPAFLGGSLMVSHPANTPSSTQCVSATTSMDKQTKSTQFDDSLDSFLLTRHQSFVQTLPQLAKLPPSRYIPGQSPGMPLVASGTGNCDSWAQERVTVKQENLTCAYLEDVNDIVQRDLKGQKSDPGDLQQPPCVSDFKQ